MKNSNAAALPAAPGKRKKREQETVGAGPAAPQSGTRQGSRQPPDPPQYDDGYSLMAKELLDRIYEASFSESGFGSDGIYEELRESYEKEAEKAAENIFGLASTHTGGYGNSYAASAAAAAFEEYDGRLREAAARERESAEKRRTDGLYRLLDAVRESDDREYKRYRDALDSLNGQKKQDRDFAFEAGRAGDYSFLEKLGLDTSALKRRDDESEAEFLARFGDYSGLERAGVDLTKLSRDELISTAKIFAQYGDYSLLEALGADTESKNTEDYYKNLILKERYKKYLRG